MNALTLPADVGVAPNAADQIGFRTLRARTSRFSTIARARRLANRSRRSSSDNRSDTVISAPRGEAIRNPLRSSMEGVVSQCTPPSSSDRWTIHAISEALPARPPVRERACRNRSEINRASWPGGSIITLIPMLALRLPRVVRCRLRSGSKVPRHCHHLWSSHSVRGHARVGSAETRFGREAEVRGTARATGQTAPGRRLTTAS